MGPRSLTFIILRANEEYFLLKHGPNSIKLDQARMLVHLVCTLSPVDFYRSSWYCTISKIIQVQHYTIKAAVVVCVVVALVVDRDVHQRI